MKKAICLLLIMIVTSGCATVYNPATGRQDKICALVTPAVEQVLAGYCYADVYKRYSGGLYEDARLNTIGQRVAAASGRNWDFRYRFIVVNDSTPNAFTASGGYIYVTKGLIEMSSSDDELACVIGHELGHDSCRHMAKRLPAIIGYPILMQVISKKSDKKDIQRIVNVMYQIIASGYSRQDEREADKLGVQYAYSAGYDPKAFITFFNKLQQKSSQVYIPLLATHPPISERIANVTREISYLDSYADNGTAKNIGTPKMALPATPPKTALPVKDGKIELPKKALPIDN